MNTKEIIEDLKKAIDPQYQFPYYALVRVTSRRDGVFHIPAPWFDGPSSPDHKRSSWAGALPIASDMRDGEYYACPICGEHSFYSGVCQDCGQDLDVWDEEECEWVNGPLPAKLQNREVLKKEAKRELLRRIDSGTKDLGIVKAEIVLSVPWGAEWDQSAFLRKSNISAEQALWRVGEVLKTLQKQKEDTESRGEVMETYPELFSDDESEVIEVEGSDELRRVVDGVWQHKHPSDGYDYWHPMGRVHKEQAVAV